jgi:hypothetical protein
MRLVGVGRSFRDVMIGWYNSHSPPKPGLVPIGNGRIIHDILGVMIEELVSFKFDMFVLINFWLSKRQTHSWY